MLLTKCPLWLRLPAFRRRCVVVAFFLLVLLPLVVLFGRWFVAVVVGDDSALADVVPSARSLNLLLNSLALGAVVAGVSTALGTALAIWLEGRRRARRIVGALYLIPLLIPPYIHALEWMAVAGRRQILDRLLSSLPAPLDVSLSAYGFWPTALVLAMALFPIVTLFVRRGLRAIPPELVEAGSLVGTSSRTWWRVLLPLLAPSIVAAAGLVFVMAMVEYGVPSLLQCNVFVMEVYASFSQHFDPVRAFAAALPLVVMTTAILALSHSGLKSSPLTSRAASTPLIETESWPATARVFLTLAAVVWGLAVSVPVLVLCARGGSPAVLGQAASVAFDELVRTAAVAAIAGLVATVVAVPLALFFVRRMTGFRWFLLALPLAVPAPLTAIALISIWNRPSLAWGYGTLLMLVLAHLARFLPFAAFAAFSGVRNIEPIYFEAAALFDVDRRRRFFHVTLPILLPTIIITWLITFVLSLGELGASLLLSPPGQATVPLVVYNLLHYGATETVSALALLILLVAGSVSAGVLVMRGRLTDKST